MRLRVCNNLNLNAEKEIVEVNLGVTKNIGWQPPQFKSVEQVQKVDSQVESQPESFWSTKVAAYHADVSDPERSITFTV